MVKMPRIPQDWMDQSNGAPRPDLDGGSAGLLGDARSQVAQAAPTAPANAAPALPAGVDWDFIGQREGSRTDGYVPPDENGGPDANSGVTIGTGFDLGGRTPADLRRLGLSEDMVTRLMPYLNLHGQAAQDYLTAHPLNITTQQQQAIDMPTFASTYNTVADNYNAAQTGGTRFQDLPRGAQTAIVSVAHQYGTNLNSATPHFWDQVTHGRWQDAHDNLMNFGDAYRTRRRLEGGLVRDEINAGNLATPPANIARPRPGR